MKPGDIVMWLSVGLQQRHRQHMKRYAELVSIEPNGRYAKIRIVNDDRKEVVVDGVCLTQLEQLTLDEEIELQHLKGNDVEVRGLVAAIVPKDYSVYRGLKPEVYTLLDKIDDSGKRIKRIDLFGGEITVQFDDDSNISKKVGKPLENVYALRKWFKIKNQSWGPLEDRV